MRIRSTFLLALLSALSVAAPAFPAHAQTAEERQYLLLYFREEELVVESPTRSSKPVTRTAENVTVITAGDIRLLNAHTLAEVLNTVAGVQVFLTGGPGSTATASLQGSDSRHVAVFIDGIPLNNLSDNAAEIGSLPVQNIEKIEIVKGPASSSWGSALGGVINIITKTGADEGTDGLLSASRGRSGTADSRAEASGTQARLGYYITAGRLETDGFRPHNAFSGDNGYAKLNYAFTDRTTLSATVSYDDFTRGIGELPAFGIYIDNDSRSVRSSLALRSTLSDRLDLQVSAWHKRQHYDFTNYLQATGAELSRDSYLDDAFGGSVKLEWRQGSHALVLGGDYDLRMLNTNTIAGGRQRIERQAVFMNDTMTFGRVSVIPGLRYDKTDTNGDITSPSLGVTWQLAASTVLRAYAARGFNVPPLGATYGDNLFHVPNPDLDMEKVRSYQAGIESGAGAYLWAKVSLFRHDLENGLRNEALSPFTFITRNSGRERREGMELEIKTVSIHHATLSAGAAFLSARDRDTGETIQSVPQRTYDLGLQYARGPLTALVKAHYVYWNTDPAFEGKYDDFIVDGHVTWAFPAGRGRSLEVFADAHNILDGEQYPFGIYPNPGRWYEAGARYLF